MTSTGVATNFSVMDCNIDAMLCKSQSKKISDEGKQVGKQLDVLIEKMEDYFDLAHLTVESKAIIAHFKLEKSAKLWWKDHCTESGVDAQNITWPYIKDKLTQNYQNKTYIVEHIIEFLDSRQGNKDLEGYYQHFLTLLKYAPQGMTQEIKVAHFILGLNSLMDTHMQALQLTTFVDVLEAGKPIKQELAQQAKRAPVQSKVRENQQPCLEGNFHPIAPIRRDNTLLAHLKERAFKDNLCFTCLELNRCRRNCPYNGNARRNMQPIE